MPFLDDAEPVPLPTKPAEPSFGALVGAAFTRENTIGSLIEAASQPAMSEPDASYDPFAQIEGYEDRATAFIAANSDADVAAIKLRIDDERRRERMLQEGGALGMVAALGASVLDPTVLIPAGGQIYAATRLGRAALGALRTGAGVGAGVAVQEGVLQATQETRPLSESLINVGGATFLGGVLGTAVGALGRPLTREMADRAIRDAELYERELTGSVGAAAVRNTTLDQETFLSALGAENVLARTSPTLRLGTSPSVEVRRIAQELADQPLDFKKNVEGIPTAISVERRAMLAQGPLAEALTELDDLFVQYRLGRARNVGDVTRIAVGDIAGQTGGKLTYDQFAEAVSRAMRRTDAAAIPEVEAAARMLRAKVFDPLKVEAIAVKLLPEDVKVTTAPSYLTRLYDTAKIAANRPAFEKIVSDWLGITPETRKLDPAEIDDLATMITDGILGLAPGRTAYAPIPLARGPLRERTFNIPDHLIEEFLENDIRRIARAYTRTMATDVELTRAFGRADMQEQLDRVRQHYAVLKNGATPAQAKKLDAALARDLRDIEAVRDRIRGTYALPDNPDGLANRAYHLVRDLNYLRLMGGMTLSAIPDLGRTVMTHGVMRVVGDGLVPMLKDFRQFRLAAGEAKLAGAALDMVLDTRAMSMADILEDAGRWSKYERGVQAMTSKFGIVSLMAPWNAALKQFVGVVGQTRTLQAIEKIAAGKGVGRERTRLASLGIGDDMVERIHAEFQAHGSKGDVWWANTAAWTDRDAATAFRAALAKEIDTAIVTPGQERPLWMTGSAMGRMLSQFKSFAMASTQRVMLTGLQRRDMATLNGAALMVGLGTLSWWIRQQLNPNAKELPDPSTPSGAAQWMREGLDRSGLTGWIFDVHNTVEKLTRGTVGLSAITGGEPMSRYASRGAVEALLGPTVGLAVDGAQAVGAAASGQWAASDTSAVRRMVPFQNLFYIRTLLDEAEAGLNQTLGVPVKR